MKGYHRGTLDCNWKRYIWGCYDGLLYEMRSCRMVQALMSLEEK